jgi:hypothetical protein
MSFIGELERVKEYERITEEAKCRAFLVNAAVSLCVEKNEKGTSDDQENKQ